MQTDKLRDGNTILGSVFLLIALVELFGRAYLETLSYLCLGASLLLTAPGTLRWSSFPRWRRIATALLLLLGVALMITTLIRDFRA